MKPYLNSVIEHIGHTPMVKINHMNTGLCECFLKLENENPGGSIKDRMALSMISGAEQRGQLKPGGTIVEATAGNTGIGLALVSATRGYRLILVIPDKMSREKIDLLEAMGAKTVITRSDVNKGHPEYYQDLAQTIATSTKDAFYIDQFNNPDNPLAHERTTAPEIWEQMAHDVDAIVVGVGSSGTLTGLTAFFKKVNPNLSIIIADPVGSVLVAHAKKQPLPKPGSWFVEGIGEDFIPPMADFSMVKQAYSVSDQESFVAARRLQKQEGILAGSSSGTLLHAALKYASEQTEKRRIVTFVCDSGERYLSKMYNDEWMAQRGWPIEEVQS